MVNFGFTFDSDGTMVLTDAAPYNNGSGIIFLSYTTTGVGSITFNTDNYLLIPGEVASCWVTRSNATGRFYAANAGSYAISEFTRSGNTLTVNNEYYLGNNTSPTDVTVVSIGTVDYLFVNEEGPHVIGGFKLVPAGTAVSLGGVSSHTGAHGAGLATFVTVAPTTTGTPSSASIVTLMPLVTFIAMLLL